MSSGDSGTQGGTAISGAVAIEAMRLVTLRAALRLEIRTGMRRSNRGRSTLTLVNEALGTRYRGKAAAYEALDAWVTANIPGTVSRPLETGKGKA